MENAQLIGLSRQMALRRQMDVVANNMANLNTTGFKAEEILFASYDMPVAKDRDFKRQDQPLSYVQDWATRHDLTSGAIVDTGNELDVALMGDGFLAVDTPAGERWTRSGSLQIDATGTLVDTSGNPVLGDGGPIVFDPTETGITISAEGTIATDQGPKGRLRLVEFADPQELTREGNNLYAGGAPLPAQDTAVMQGSLERSNVSGVTEMAEMIRVQRAYESIAGLMRQQDDLRRSAIQRLGDATA
ncbi:flagellar basal-body rod protein FlgF [Devosia pacifica]|uniref:flagellar basal-body rod protein FlgF n=1 Tax=Devosia pacifica TaxID=1335967 RepID=UPI0016780660|nr:flagellar basal-body rod protein FlgF [Devosia pacifica]